MTRPIINTPKGSVFINKKGSAELKLNLKYKPNFKPKWQGRYDSAQVFVDSEVLRLCEPYIPLLSSMLIKSGILGTDPGSGEVKWIAPYAHKQYFSARKPGRPTGPLRGPHWFDRMKPVHGKKIVEGARRIAGTGIKIGALS